MNHPETTKMRIKICPICGDAYHTPKEAPTPTCGKPTCIREARDRGLPIVASAPIKPEKPKKPKKSASSKSRKSRS